MVLKRVKQVNTTILVGILSTYSLGGEKDRIYKKKTYGYREIDEAKRHNFMEKQSSLADDEIVYGDESGMDERDDYGYGYSKKGERFHDLKSGRRNGRVSISYSLPSSKNYGTTPTYERYSRKSPQNLS